MSIFSIVLFGSLTFLAEPQSSTAEVHVDRDVAVPMRDGVILRADVHRPDRGGPYPVLLLRTPYGKTGKAPPRYVKAGYIVVCQDVRGRYASEGTFESFVRFQNHDAEDGYDTVQWAARLPNSTGKVGTYGASYNSFLQWRLATLRPPALVAMAARTIPARYTDLEGPGTLRPGRRLQWWITTMDPDIRYRAGRDGPDAKAKAVEAWTAGDGEKWLHFLPWLNLPRECFEHETEVVQYWLRHPYLDPWKLDEGCKEIAVPNLDVIGWHDHCNGDVRLYRALAADGKTEIARKRSRVIIGPWGHSTLGKRKFGEIDFGPEAEVDLVTEDIRWFDYCLKGQANGEDKDPPVRIFVLGDNGWRNEQAWPLSRAKQQAMYLASGGRANTPGGDGRLLDQAPMAQGNDRYSFDPRDPVRTLFGKNSFTAVADQRPLAHRQDILVYQTEPLKRRIEVTGNPTVELCAATSAPDTDWFVRLIDVAPDGLARDCCMGMVRARERNSREKPELLKPGEVVRYTIRLGPTSNAFLPGHRIRLDVTSSDFPNYDRSHNTAADPNADVELVTAQQTVYNGRPRASRILLPVIAEPASAPR